MLRRLVNLEARGKVCTDISRVWSMTAGQDALHTARHFARKGRFEAFLAQCRKLRAQYASDAEAQLELAALLAAYGFLSEARACLLGLSEQPGLATQATLQLANIARDTGDHVQARTLFEELLRRHPTHAGIHRSFLTTLEYDPQASSNDRLAQAKAWAAMVHARIGGQPARPAMAPRAGRALRIAYVSADLCQHTVGLFLKDVLAAHDPVRVQVFAYSAGKVRDWVQRAIRGATVWRDVADLDDAALAAPSL